MSPETTLSPTSNNYKEDFYGEMKLHLIHAKIFNSTLNESPLEGCYFGNLDLEDKDSSRMRLNITEQQRDHVSQIINKAKGQNDDVLVRVTNVKQKLCKHSNRQELYSCNNSVIEVVDFRNEEDIILHGYDIKKVNFLDHNGSLVCSRDCSNITFPLDNIEKTLFESCIYCFYAVRKGIAAHNKGMVKVRYCPKCGKEYRIHLMFTNIQVLFQRRDVKHFGDVRPQQIKAMFPYSVIVKLFKESLASSCYGILSEDFHQTLRADLLMLLTKSYAIKVTKNLEEEFSIPVSDDIFTVKDITII